MNPSRVRATFIHSGESVVVTPSGTYEQVGDEVVIRHVDGTVVARLARDQVQVSAARAEADFERIIHIRRQSDGSWTAHPEPPLAPTSTFLTGGWSEISSLRTSLRAVEHFESDGYKLFVEEFGEPPA